MSRRTATVDIPLGAACRLRQGGACVYLNPYLFGSARTAISKELERLDARLALPEVEQPSIADIFEVEDDPQTSTSHLPSRVRSTYSAEAPELKPELQNLLVEISKTNVLGDSRVLVIFGINEKTLLQAGLAVLAIIRNEKDLNFLSQLELERVAVIEWNDISPFILKEDLW